MSAAPHRRRFRGSDPRRTAIGWGVVVAVHAFIGWALVSGTARKHLEIVNKPMQAAVIQEVVIPPPPPRIEPPKPPPPRPAPRKKIEAPKPRPPRVVEPAPYVPPPEVAPPPSPAAMAVQSAPLSPPAPPVISAPPPAPPAAAAAPPAPARQDMTVACPEQVRPEIPPKALRDGTQGVVKAQAVIRDGVVKEVTILSGPRVYHAPVREAMLQYKCLGDGEVIATQEFVFKID